MQPVGFLGEDKHFDPLQGLETECETLGKIKVLRQNVDTFYLIMRENPYSFNHTLVDMNLVFEYNFSLLRNRQRLSWSQTPGSYILGGWEQPM